MAAGQLIDRAGGHLGLRFPAGRELDGLSRKSTREDFFAPKVNGLTFSLSGVENKVQEYYFDTKSKENTAYYALRSVISGNRPPLRTPGSSMVTCPYSSREGWPQTGF